MIIKVSDTGEEAKEISFYKLLRWYPKLFSLVVDDLVLVRVTVDSKGTGRSGKEVRKKVD